MVFILMMTLLLAARDAGAYVDPGTGSYFLQILLAGLLGAAFAVRLYWRKIKSFLTGTGSGRDKRGEDRQTGEDGKG
jgi:hypothetical protein